MTTTVTETVWSQTYYAECRRPDEVRGVRMGITLKKTLEDQALPEALTDYPCISSTCPHGGTHTLTAIPEHAVDKLLGEESEPRNVFEWCLEYPPGEGDDQRVLEFLAFHSAKEPAEFPYRDEVETALGIDHTGLTDIIRRLSNSGQAIVSFGRGTCLFPAYEEWRASQ